MPAKKNNSNNEKPDRKSISKPEQSEEPEDSGNLDCGECGKKCSGISGLKNHLQDVHGKDVAEVEDLLDCTKCGKKCKSMAGLVNHMRFEHDKGEGNEETRKLKCDECGKLCKNATGIWHHLRLAHGINLTCTECGKTMSNSNAYKLHMTFHDQKRKDQVTDGSTCKVCKKVFVTKSAYETHKKSHKRRSDTPEAKPGSSPKKIKIECALCKQIFKSLSSLNTHKKVEHAKDYFCFTCEKSFNFRSVLRKHFEQRHTGEKMHFESSSEDEEEETVARSKARKFECTLCKQIFKTAVLLKTHKKESHARDHFCFTCEKSFPFRSLLKKHFSKPIHEGEKMHFESSSGEEPEGPEVTCSLCKQSFASNGLLKSHQKIDHAKDHYCFICKSTFPFASFLRKHFQAKHKDQKLHVEYSTEDEENDEETKKSSNECGFCDKNEIGELAKHLQISHQISKLLPFIEISILSWNLCRQHRHHSQ